MLSRESWFETYISPLLKAARPSIHFTFAMFGNKSRHEKAFDHRRETPELRALAKSLHDAELEALDSHRKPEFDDNNRIVVKKILAYLDADVSKGAEKRRCVRELKLDVIQKAIPNFTAFDFKCYAPKIKDTDSEKTKLLKAELRAAYQEMHFFRQSGTVTKVERVGKNGAREVVK